MYRQYPKVFIEMFSGIGGFRLGLERSGWKCVWANDIDKWACAVYRYRFGDGELVEGDIRQVDTDEIPDHTLLTAGFPCQSFSLAGKRKGFEDTRGTLFYDIARVAEAKRPPLLLLENVKGLLSVQRGYCFARILQTLDELGYDVEWQVLNSKHFGVPQNRERVFIIGHLRGTGGQQIFPIFGASSKASGEVGCESEKQVSTTLDANYWKGADNYGQRTLVAESGLIHSRGLETRKDGVCHALKGGSGGSSKNVIVYDGHHYQATEEMGTLTGRENRQGTNWVVVVADRTRSYAGIGRNLESPKETTNALSGVPKDNLLVWFLARTETKIIKVGNIYPSGGEAGKVVDSRGVYPTVKQGKRGGKAGMPLVALFNRPYNSTLLSDLRIRRLTPIECERLQGFPNGWTRYGKLRDGKVVEVSDTQRYKLLGNAVTVNVVEFLGRKLSEILG